MNDNLLTGLESLFLALCDKTRLRILGLIGSDEVSVGYLVDRLGESQPKISRHLAYLRATGLVTTRRHGKWIYYSVASPGGDAALRILTETMRVLGSIETDPIQSVESITRAAPSDREPEYEHEPEIEIELVQYSSDNDNEMETYLL